MLLPLPVLCCSVCSSVPRSMSVRWIVLQSHGNRKCLWATWIQPKLPTCLITHIIVSQQHSNLQTASGVSQLKSHAGVNTGIRFLIIFHSFLYTFRFSLNLLQFLKGFCCCLFACLVLVWFCCFGFFFCVVSRTDHYVLVEFATLQQKKCLSIHTLYFIEACNPWIVIIFNYNNTTRAST